MQVAGDGRRLAQRGEQLAVDVVHLDRGEPEARQARRRPPRGRAARACSRPRGRGAAEVDARQHDLAVALLDAAPNLGEDRLRPPAARRAAHLRDHAEIAREAAAVLNLDERAHPVETCIRLDAADRADVTGDEAGVSSLGLATTMTFAGRPREGVAGEVRAAAGDVDPAVRPRRTRAAWRDFAPPRASRSTCSRRRRRPQSARLAVAVGHQRSRISCASVCETLQPRNRTENVAMGAQLYSRANRSAAQPSPVRRSRRRKPAGAGSSATR